ncbi:hypothetical protein FA15DRAFT_653786 [Coprinopsis marcescibilis]|uniref:Uncharacterized protein n=1 Tax=Coprinopsis marcescibilis TaxID=230819 RepID=A0A5C3L2X7_COPMA|nr:hypothetical protein FA15DRAFT_653786 [Coprinopsis marcescibilis]
MGDSSNKGGCIQSLRDGWTTWRLSIEAKVEIDNQANVGRQFANKLPPAVASIAIFAAGLAIGVGTARFLRTGNPLRRTTLKQTAVFDYANKGQHLSHGQASRIRRPTRPFKPSK